MALLYGLLGVCLVGSALGQLPSWGSCPEIDAMQDFDSSKFMGKWYEAQRYFAAFEFSAQCVVAEFSTAEDGTVRLVASAIFGLTGHRLSEEVDLHVPNSAEPAQFKINVPSAPVGGNILILGTDYDSYAVIYSCTNMALAHFKNVWILTREQDPSNDAMDKVFAVMENNGLYKKWLMKTQQQDCEVKTNEIISEK